MSKVINYYWRLIGTALSFTLFGLGGVILSVTLFPLISLFTRDLERRKRRGQRTVSLTFRFFLKFMQVMGVCTYEFRGVEKLREQRGRLIIANHPSLIDVVLLVALFERADCIVKSALLKNPFMIGPIKAAGYIPNEGPEQLMDACVDTVAAGNSLIIFPEGTRTTPGKPLKFQRGAAGIAVRAQKAITPVVISCEPTTLTKAEKWYQIPSRRFHVTLTIKEDLHVRDIVGDDMDVNLPRATRKLTRYLEDYFKKEIA